MGPRKKGAASAPVVSTLIPAGHFSNLTPPTLASLADHTYASNFTGLTGSRNIPTQFKNLTISSSTRISSNSVGAIYLWIDLMTLNNSSFIDASGQTGSDATGNCCCGVFGGNGAVGGAGGGGGAATSDLEAPSGLGGPFSQDCISSSSTDGTNGGVSGGCPVPAFPGAGGLGFARNDSGGGYLSQASPFSYLFGGNGGLFGSSGGCCAPSEWGQPFEAGYGGGGLGGEAFPSCGQAAAAGGGGGGGNSLVAVMRELDILSTSFLTAQGGDGGATSTCSSNFGAGGGGGSIQLFIAKISTASLANLHISIGGGSGQAVGDNGNFAIYEINTAGTILATHSNTIPATGWDHT